MLPLAKQVRVVSAVVTIDNDSAFPTKPQTVIYERSFCDGLRGLVAWPQFGGRMNMCGVTLSQSFVWVGVRPDRELETTRIGAKVRSPTGKR